MHKIERDVSLPDHELVVPDQSLPHAREYRSWGCFGLNEPAVIEAETTLRELNGPPLLGTQVPERRQQVREKVHDVAQSVVMVADRVTSGIAVVRRMVRFNNWAILVHLHDVVDRRQGEQGHEAHFAHGDAAALLPHQTGVDQQPREVVPPALLPERQPLVGRAQLPPLGGLRPHRHPVLVHAEGEAVLAVHVEPHEPVDGEEGPHRPLVLVPNRAARICVLRLGTPALAVQQVQAELWEGVEVPVEVPQRVLRLRDAPRHLPHLPPVRGLALHGRAEGGAGRAAALPGHAGPHLGQGLRADGRQRDPLDQHPRVAPRVHRVGPPAGLRGRGLPARGGHGGARRVAGPGPDVELGANGQPVLLDLHAEVEVALGRGELLPVREANALDAGVLRLDDAEGDVVDTVQRVEPRVAVALHVVLRVVAICARVLLEMLLLPLLGEAEPLVKCSGHAGPPVLRVRAILGVDQVVVRHLVPHAMPGQLFQGHLPPFVGLAVVHELQPREERVVDAEDLGHEPDFHEPGDTLHGAWLRHAGDDATLLLVGLPEQVLDRLGPRHAPP
mmetsp:Transcript_4236/g.12011  ORF Transcript_4236/g.12011 Transcript_4236/m.12011 type:complete len:559 (+) Transcript_4236:919-2595(+)